MKYIINFTILLFILSCQKEIPNKQNLFSGKLKEIKLIESNNTSKYLFLYDTNTLQLVDVVKDSIVNFLHIDSISTDLFRLSYLIETSSGNTSIKYNVYHNNNNITMINNYDTLGGYEFEYNTIRFPLRNNLLDTFWIFPNFNIALLNGITQYDYRFQSDSIFYTIFYTLCQGSCNDYLLKDTVVLNNIINNNILPFQQLHSLEDLTDPLYILGIMGYFAYPPNNFLIKKKKQTDFIYEQDANQQITYMKYFNEYRFTYY